MPNGDGGVALYTTDNRLPVLQRSFHPPRLRACQSAISKIPAATGDVASRLTNHLRHGRHANDD